MIRITHYSLLTTIRRNLRLAAFASLLFLIVTIPLAIYLAKNANITDAAWWDDSYTYRQKIIISKTTADQTNVYIAFDAGDVLDTSDTTKFQNDCGDIRFVKQNGEVLPHYINSGCGTSSTDIDVLFNSINVGDHTIYMYYGNSTAPDGFEASGFSTEATNYTIGTPASEEVGPGPIAYWKFDEGYGATTNDTTRHENSGTINGASWTESSLCVSEKCLQFDGSDDYVTRTDDADFDPDGTDSFTLQMWARFGPKSAAETLFAKRGSLSNLSANVIDTSTSASATANSFQRKTWYDGTRYWVAFHSDADNRIEFWYSTTGTSWTENTSARLSIDTNDFSITGDSSNAFINYAESGSIMAREASSYPGTGFSWGAASDVLALSTTTVISYGSEYIFNNASTFTTSSIALSSTSFVMAFSDGGNSSYGTAIVGTVSGTTISYGSEYVFNSAATSAIDITVVDSNTIAIIFRDNGNSYYGTAIVGTLSGTTISYGSEYVFYSGNTNSISIATLDTNKFVVAYIGTANYGTARIGTVSGNTISYGSEYAFNSASTGYISVAVLSSSKFVVGYRDLGNSLYGTARVGTVSGTTISYSGSEYVYNSATTSVLSVAALSSSSFVVAYRDDGNSYSGTAIIGTVSGSTISYGSEYVFDTVSSNDQPMSVAALSSSSFVVVYNLITSEYGRSTVGTVSGSTISYGANYYFKFAISGDVSAAALSSSEFVVGYRYSSKGAAAIGTLGTTTYSSPTLASDSNSKIWTSATKTDGTNYLITAVQSTNANDITAWQTATDLDTSTNSNKYGLIVPRTSGVVYAAWVDGTTIEGKNYNGSAWDGSPTTIGTASTGLTNNISATGDSDGDVHLTFIDDGSDVTYRRYNGSWQTAVDLDTGTNTNTSISVDESDSNALYAFWVNSNSVYYKKGISDYTSGNWDAAATQLVSSGTNTQVSSMATDGGAGYIGTVFTEGSGSPYDIEFAGVNTSTGLGTGYQLGLESDGDITFGIDDDEAGFPEDSASTTTGDLDDNSWHHVSVVKNGTSSIQLYVDAQLVSEDTDISATGSLATSGNVFLGIGGDGFINPFSGFIDEFKYYPYARSADEIKVDFNKGATANFSPENSYLSQGLVGYWNIDESSGNANDSSGNGTSLTNTGTATFSSARFGNGTELNGSSQYFDAVDSATLSVTGSVTLSAWINPDDTTGSQDIIGKWDGANESYLLSMNGSNLEMFIDSSSNYQTTTGSPLSAAMTHVVGVYDALTQTVTLYVNGVAKASSTTGTIPASITDDGGAFSLGAQDPSGTPANYFDGHIDEARVYNRALSPAEVEALYYWAPGPVGHWKMDENTGTTTTYDSSGNDNEATLTGSMTEEDWVVGKFGSALSFDGSTNYLNLGHPSSLNTGNMFTLSAWVYPTSAPSGASVITEGFSGGSDPVQYSIGFGMDEGGGGSSTLKVGFFNGTSWALAADTGNITLNQWVHIAGTWNGTTLNLYKNGILIDTDTPGTTTSNDTEDFYIGRRHDLGGDVDYFPGIIDEAKIYNYARTPQQVIEDMNAGHPAPGSPIGSAIGHWKFDEGYGTTAHDSGTGVHDLTLSAASWTNSGKFDHAWNGDGAKYVSVADNADHDFGDSEDLTLSLWVKSDATANPGAAEVLMNKKVPTNNPGYQIAFNTSGYVTCGIDDDTTSFPEDSATTTTDYYDNTWHHLVCVRNITADTLDLYIDGLRVAQDTDLSATGSLLNADNLSIGDEDESDDGDEFFGDIDEVSIYRSALTADQVKVLYNQGSQSTLGSLSTTAAGVADNSTERSYCPPGDTTASCAPISHWKLDENTGTSTAYNSIPGGFDLTLTSITAADWVPGKLGSGIDFDGSSDYATVTGEGATFSTNTFSASAWIMRHTDSGATEHVVSNMDGTDDGWKLVVSSTDKIGCVYNAVPAQGTTNLAVNTWYHVACTSDGTTLSAYLNGVLADDSALTGNISETTDMTIGTLTGGTQKFPGIIDDVRVYDYTRTPAQVAWDYNQGGPIGWWKLDDNVTGDAQTVYDSSGNGNVGTTVWGANASGMDCTVTGRFSTACDLDGTDDYININTSAAEMNPNRGSQTAWVYRDFANNVSENKYVVNHNASGANLIGILYDASVDLWHFRYSGSGVQDNAAVAADTIPQSTWTHVGLTWDRTADVIYAYVNGNRVATSTGLSAFSGTIANGRIGALSTTLEFDGKIDEVKAYNYALTDEQMAIDYQQGAVKFGP